MSIAAAILLMSGVMVGFGTLDPLLERAKLSKRRAMAILLILFAGTIFSPMYVLRVRVLPGILLTITAASMLIMRGCPGKMWVRALFSAVLMASVLASLTILLPYGLDELAVARYVFLGLVGGMISGGVAGSVKAAAAGTLLGSAVFDLAEGLMNFVRDKGSTLLIGHTELADQAMIAMVTAVGCAVMVEIGMTQMKRFSRKAGRT